FAAAVLGPGFRRALFLAGPAGAVPLLKTGDGAPGGGSIRDFFVGVLDAAARVSVGPGGFASQAELARTSGATGLFLRLGGRRVRQASHVARWSSSALVRGSSWSVYGRGTSSSPAAMPHPTAVVSRTSRRRSSPPIASSSTRPSRAALTPKESSASPAPRRRRPRRSRPSPGSVVPHP